MEAYENHFALATALAVGILIGLEREQTKPERPSTLAGVRTYPIFALVGALATMLEPASMWLPLVALLGVFALVAISYAADLRRPNEGKEDHGVTTEISVIATYMLGALADEPGRDRADGRSPRAGRRPRRRDHVPVVLEAAVPRDRARRSRATTSTRR